MSLTEWSIRGSKPTRFVKCLVVMALGLVAFAAVALAAYLAMGLIFYAFLPIEQAALASKLTLTIAMLYLILREIWEAS